MPSNSQPVSILCEPYTLPYVFSYSAGHSPTIGAFSSYQRALAFTGFMLMSLRSTLRVMSTMEAEP